MTDPTPDAVVAKARTEGSADYQRGFAAGRKAAVQRENKATTDEHRIYTAEEARALREAATPGPWGVWQIRGSGDSFDVWPDSTRETCIAEGLLRSDAALVAAAPNLAATVEHLYGLLAKRGEIAVNVTKDYAGPAIECECGRMVPLDARIYDHTLNRLEAAVDEVETVHLSAPANTGKPSGLLALKRQMIHAKVAGAWEDKDGPTFKAWCEVRSVGYGGDVAARFTPSRTWDQASHHTYAPDAWDDVVFVIKTSPPVEPLASDFHMGEEDEWLSAHHDYETRKAAHEVNPWRWSHTLKGHDNAHGTAPTREAAMREADLYLAEHGWTLAPEPPKTRGLCRDCQWSLPVRSPEAQKDYGPRLERGYADPCGGCTRPLHSHFQQQPESFCKGSGSNIYPDNAERAEGKGLTGGYCPDCDNIFNREFFEHGYAGVPLVPRHLTDGTVITTEPLPRPEKP